MAHDELRSMSRTNYDGKLHRMLGGRCDVSAMKRAGSKKYAGGGGVLEGMSAMAGDSSDKPMGGERRDRPSSKGKKGHNINIVIAPQAAQHPPMPMMGPPGPPPMMGPPPGPPPGLPPRPPMMPPAAMPAPGMGGAPGGMAGGPPVSMLPRLPTALGPATRGRGGKVR